MAQLTLAKFRSLIVKAGEKALQERIGPDSEEAFRLELDRLLEEFAGERNVLIEWAHEDFMANNWRVFLRT